METGSLNHPMEENYPPIQNICFGLYVNKKFAFIALSNYTLGGLFIIAASPTVRKYKANLRNYFRLKETTKCMYGHGKKRAVGATLGTIGKI